MSEEKPARPKWPRDKPFAGGLLELTGSCITESFCQLHELLELFDTAHRIDAELAEAALQQRAQKASQDYVEHMISDMISFLQLPRLFYASFAIILFAAVEAGLNGVCEALQLDLELTLNYRDIAGAGIERAKTYIEKVARFPFERDSAEWQAIRRLNKVRNAFAHNEGVILQASVAQDLKRVEGITVEERDRGDRIEHEIALSSEYCRSALASAANFLGSLARYDR